MKKAKTPTVKDVKGRCDICKKRVTKLYNVGIADPDMEHFQKRRCKKCAEDFYFECLMALSDYRNKK